MQAPLHGCNLFPLKLLRSSILHDLLHTLKPVHKGPMTCSESFGLEHIECFCFPIHRSGAGQHERKNTVHGSQNNLQGISLACAAHV